MAFDPLRPPEAHRDFAEVMDLSIYEPLPDDWVVGVTDIVDSTKAISNGRYEDVNFAGLSVISAVGNARKNYDFPFTFGGDGAGFALPPGEQVLAERVLQQVSAHIGNVLNLDLRAGVVQTRQIRENGYDVRIARYGASPFATYSMFAGGGLMWAESELKHGRLLLPFDPAASPPDLSGLSCDWDPFPNRNGSILSLLVEPRLGHDGAIFTELARTILALIDEGTMRANPVPPSFPAKGRSSEKAMDMNAWSIAASNADFKKYDDVLRLTADCTTKQIEDIRSLLEYASMRGHIYYGLHVQAEVIMTCLIPTDKPHHNLHFLDGNDGGYARAAANLRSSRDATIRPTSGDDP